MNPNEKETIVHIIQSLLLRQYVVTDVEAIKALSDLKKDIDDDFYMVIVLGEFKRGKSTFVNALIRKKLLPADVLPTTATINALMYDDHDTVQVVMNDGSCINGIATREYLNQFSAGNGNDAANVRYIKIGCHAPILENKVIIVDTPGVSDINEQRVQVTYDFIPKANAVLFLLDATSPLKETEKEFIDQHLLSIGLDNILFLANKYDEIDEEEDDDVLYTTQCRMSKAFQDSTGRSTLKDITILPLSAKMALEGIILNNKEDIALSGIEKVEKKILDILQNGSATAEKMRRYRIRLVTIIDGIKRNLQNQINMQSASKEELQQAMAQLEGLIEQYSQHKKSIDKYVTNEQNTILAMTDKSLICFHQKVKETISDQVECYNGTDFKEFVETQITKQLKRNMEAWVDVYSSHIDQLLINLERSLARGLAAYFNSQIQLHSGFQMGMATNHKFNFNLDAEDVSGATVQAGAIAAGGAGLIMLIGGPVIMPFVGFLAYPMLQKKFLKDKLNEAKAQIHPVINDQLVKSMVILQNEIHKSIEERIICIRDNTNAAYMSLLEKVKDQMQEQIHEKETARQGIEESIQHLADSVQELEQISIQLHKQIEEESR
jgi:GTPase SAR1 family protein